MAVARRDPSAAAGAAPDSGRRRPDVDWRPPEHAHRDQIAEIVSETGLFRPDEIDVALEVFDGFCESPGTDYWAIGAFTAPDQLAGFAFYGPTPCTVGTWDLYWIAVRPRCQHRGIGRGLLQRAERHMAAAGARMCVIETSSRDDYSATRDFYLACGYREAARIADFYDAGDDRVTYVKRFE